MLGVCVCLLFNLINRYNGIAICSRLAGGGRGPSVDLVLVAVPFFMQFGSGWGISFALVLTGRCDRVAYLVIRFQSITADSASEPAASPTSVFNSMPASCSASQPIIGIWPAACDAFSTTSCSHAIL